MLEEQSIFACLSHVYDLRSSASDGVENEPVAKRAIDKMG